MTIEEYLKTESQNANVELTEFANDLHQYLLLNHPQNTKAHEKIERISSILNVLFYGDPSIRSEQFNAETAREEGERLQEQRKRAIQRAKKLLKSIY